MFNNRIKTKDLLRVLGYEAFWKMEHVCRLQQLIHEVAIRHRYEEDDQEELNELTSAVNAVPYNYIASARNKCIALLERMEDMKSDESDDEENMITEAIVQKKNKSGRFQNGRINLWARNRKQRSREMVKKNVHTPSQKFNKSQSNKFQNSGRKNFRYARFSNSDKTSESDMEEVPAERFRKRQKLKKKTEVKKQSCLSSDRENSMSDEITSVNKTEATKEMQSIYDSTSNSVNKIQIKSAVVKLIDFMNDFSADEDQYIAQYKQSYGYKDDKENEYEIVDEVEDDVDIEQTTESDHNFDNNDKNDDEEDRISVKSHEPQDHDEELHSALSKSTASKESNSKLP